MPHDPAKILDVLDQCASDFFFPMLDNGYVYLAATRLSVFHSEADWAIVVEVFGFSPRSGIPDIHVYTFGSRLANRKSKSDFVSELAYDRYIESNPNNESRFYFPIDGDYQDKDNDEVLSMNARDFNLRGSQMPIPSRTDYATRGIMLEDSERIFVFEFCRLIAKEHREEILASLIERRMNVESQLKLVLQLEEWHHPDLAASENPSSTECFQQIAKVAATGDANFYRPMEEPNTHWINWPDGGTL